MTFLARLFAPSETELLRRMTELERTIRHLEGEWTAELLQLTRLKNDLSNQLKSLGAYEARRKRRDEEPEEEGDGGSSFAETLRRANGLR